MLSSILFFCDRALNYSNVQYTCKLFNGKQVSIPEKKMNVY